LGLGKNSAFPGGRGKIGQETAQISALRCRPRLTGTKPIWMMMGVLCLALWPAGACAQGDLWESCMAAPESADRQGGYAGEDPSN
jgi:hypothetical protein